MHKIWFFIIAVLLLALAACESQPTSAPAPTALPTTAATLRPFPTPTGVLPTSLPTQRPFPSPTGSSATAARTPTSAGGWIITNLGGLTLAEYPVVEAAVDTPNHFEFKQRIPPAAFALREALRDHRAYTARLVAQANAVLERFGWKVESLPLSPADSRPYDLRLLQNGKELKKLEYMWPLASNSSGSAFALVMQERSAKSDTWLLTQNGLAAWDITAHAYTRPAFAGEQMLTVTRGASYGEVLVQSGGKQIYVHRGPDRVVDEPVKGLWGSGADWILEVQGEVIVSGQSLNRRIGAEEIFGWQLLKGQPFYYYSKEGKVNLSYAGQPLGVQYDALVHYQCCEPAAFNASGNDRIAWFYARRGGWWYYGEIY